MIISYSFSLNKPYTHPIKSIEKKLKSLFEEHYPDLFSISKVQLIANANDADVAIHSYSITFTCALTTIDLEDMKHVKLVEALLKQHFSAVLDTKKKTRFLNLFIGKNINASAFEVATETTLLVDCYFANLCAKNLNYCYAILKSNVADIEIEYGREGGEMGGGYATGKMRMIATGPQKAVFDKDNPYHAFANAILTDHELRKCLRLDNLDKIEMEKTENDDLRFQIKAGSRLIEISSIKNEPAANQRVSSVSVFHHPKSYSNTEASSSPSINQQMP